METLKFTMAEGAPFEAFCCAHGHPDARFKAVFATRFSPTGVIPLSQLPTSLAKELLASPPTMEGDPKMIISDIFFGNMTCVERNLAIDVFADNMTWTSAVVPLFLCNSQKMKVALIGNGFMSQWNQICLDGLSVEVVLRKGKRQTPSHPKAGKRCAS